MSKIKEALLNNLPEDYEIDSNIPDDSEYFLNKVVPYEKNVYVQFRISLVLRSLRDVENLLYLVKREIDITEHGRDFQNYSYLEIGYLMKESKLVKFLDLLDEYIGKVDSFICKQEII